MFNILIFTVRDFSGKLWQGISSSEHNFWFGIMNRNMEFQVFWCHSSRKVERKNLVSNSLRKFKCYNHCKKDNEADLLTVSPRNEGLLVTWDFKGKKTFAFGGKMRYEHVNKSVERVAIIDFLTIFLRLVKNLKETRVRKML